MVRISEGNTNNYLIPGVFVLILGVVLGIVGLSGNTTLLIVGVVITVIAFILFTASNGLELDLENKRYRRYGKFGPVLIGNWSSLNDIITIKIQIHSKTLVRASVGAVPIPRASTKSLTYDVVSVDSVNDEKEVYNFLRYRQAKEAGKTLADGLGVTLQNTVAEKLEQNRNRRRR